MVLEKTGLTEEQVMSVRDRSLKEAYEVHDVGHEIIVARLEAHGLHVEDHGDDARDADEVLYGDGPDLAVYDEEGGELLAYIEIKCKESEDWFGRCNVRHMKEYVNFSNEVDAPVFIWFALLDGETNIVHRDAFFEVEDMGQMDGDVMDVTEQQVVFYKEDAKRVNDSGMMAVDGGDVIEVDRGDVLVDSLPNIHGNDVIELDDKEFRGFPHFLYVIDT